MLELLSSPAALWCLAAFLLFMLEAFMPSFIFMFFGISALLTSALTALGLTPNISSQSIVFAIGSVITIFTLRKYAREFFVGGTKAGSDDVDDEFVGKIVTVTSGIEANGTGRVELKGADWTATSATAIPGGSRARITGRDGITLTVEPA